MKDAQATLTPAEVSRLKFYEVRIWRNDSEREYRIVACQFKTDITFGTVVRRVQPTEGVIESAVKEIQYNDIYASELRRSPLVVPGYVWSATETNRLKSFS